MNNLTQNDRALFAFDDTYHERFEGHVAGIDEAGRGPLAGPVVAAAAILLHPEKFEYLNDSKKITAARRERIYEDILKYALIGIGIASVQEVDEFNIYQATKIAMRRAVLNLPHTPELLLIDGNMKIELPVQQETIIKGDQKSASIAAASIVAKVYRDQLMVALDAIHPEYLFKQHKGYGTKQHLARIKEHGPCEIHRTSFSPISQYQKMNS